MKTRKQLFLGALIAGLIGVVGYLQHSASIKNAEFQVALDLVQSQLISVQSGLDATGIVETGIVLTGSDNTQASVTPSEPVASYEDCAPGEQPKNHGTGYDSNTVILNTWAKSHNCKFANIEGVYLDNATITFTLAKPTTRDNQVFAWFKNQQKEIKLYLSHSML